MNYFATCYTPDNSDPDRRIQGIGGSGWWYDVDTVIKMIQQGHRFYTSPPLGNGRRIIDAIHPRTLRPYITTEGDGIEQNNILALRNCNALAGSSSLFGLSGMHR